MFTFAYLLLVSQLRLRSSILPAAGVQTDKLIDSFFVTRTQMALGAEEFLGQKVPEKPQVQIDQRAGWKAPTKN